MGINAAKREAQSLRHPAPLIAWTLSPHYYIRQMGGTVPLETLIKFVIEVHWESR